MKTRKLNVVEPKVELTKEEWKERAFEFARRTIDAEIHNAVQEMDLMVRKFATRGATMFESLDGYCQDQWEGYYYEWIKGNFEREESDRSIAEFLRVLKILKKELTQALLNNYDRPTSSSSFHNASMMMKKQAQSKVLERIDMFIANIEEYI